MNSPAERLEWALNRCREAGVQLTKSRRALLGGSIKHYGAVLALDNLSPQLAHRDLEALSLTHIAS